MKIFSIIPAARIGGAEKMMLLINSALIKKGHDVVLGVGSTQGGNQEIIAKAKYILGGARTRNSIVGCVRRIKDEYPDITFLNLGYINLAPLIKLFHRSGMVIARIGNTISAEINSKTFYGWVQMRLLKMACYFCDKIVVQSEMMKDDLIQHANVEKRKIYVLKNIIADDQVQKSKDANPLKITKYMFCAASLKTQKRIDLLVNACSDILSNDKLMHLVIAGTRQDEIDETTLLSDVANVDKSRIHFLGNVENIMPMIRDSIICVSSSDYEGSSNFLIEAKSLGKCCVVTDCPGSNKEIFENYNNVIFVQPGSAKTLAAGINKALSESLNTKLEVFGEHENVWVKEKQKWDAQLNRIFQ